MISEMLNVAQCSEAQNRGAAHAALRFLSNLETASSSNSATPTSALQSVIDIDGFSPDESTHPPSGLLVAAWEKAGVLFGISFRADRLGVRPLSVILSRVAQGSNTARD